MLGLALLTILNTLLWVKELCPEVFLVTYSCCLGTINRELFHQSVVARTIHFNKQGLERSSSFKLANIS